MAPLQYIIGIYQLNNNKKILIRRQSHGMQQVLEMVSFQIHPPPYLYHLEYSGGKYNRDLCDHENNKAIYSQI